MRASVIILAVLAVWPVAAWAATPFQPDKPNSIEFPPVEARFVRLAMPAGSPGQPCIDELEVYGPGGRTNLALAGTGAKATASSCLAGYPIHQIAHLNDGLYGNDHSWISAGTGEEWTQIELPQIMSISTVVFSRDRKGRYKDRLPASVVVGVSLDGTNWETVARQNAFPTLPVRGTSPADLLPYAFECENMTWRTFDQTDPTLRVLGQMEAMLERFAAQGLDVSQERDQWAELDRRAHLLQGLSESAKERQEHFFQVRMAKRRLFLRAPELEALGKVLFVKRHPFEPSHNYSVIFDATGGPGGGICVLELPRHNGVLEPERATVKTLFDATEGVARDPMADFAANRIYFGYRRAPTATTTCIRSTPTDGI